MAESVATPPTAEPAPQQAEKRRYTGNSVWRERPLLSWLRRRSVHRGIGTAFLVLLAALFGWLVFRPLFHPNTQIQFLSGADYRPLRAPPASFALEDADALLAPDGESALLASRATTRRCKCLGR